MYPNAHDGIKKIYLGEVLSLIAVVVGSIAGIAAVIGYKVSEAGTDEIGASAAFVGGGIVVVIAGILALAAFILNILGISNASKDEPFFRKAMLWLVIGLIGSVATGMTKEGSALNLAADLVYQIGQIFVTFYVIDGVVSLAHKVGSSEVAAKGAKLKNVIIGIYVISLVLTVISKFVSGSDTMTVIAGVIAVIALIAMVIAYFMYLNLLSRAKQMLA